MRLKSHRRIKVLVLILAGLPYPVWYGVNWYAAGLVTQTALIEFNFEDDFFIVMIGDPNC